MAVLNPKIDKLIQTEKQRLVREQITPWIMGFAVGKLDIQNFHKKKISYEGIAFEGSPRDVFWNGYIEPFLEDVTEQLIHDIVNTSIENALTLENELAYLSANLKRMYGYIFDEMARADQVMRGRGFPDKIPKVDTSKQLMEMNNFLDNHIQMEVEKNKYKTIAEKNKEPATHLTENISINNTNQGNGITANTVNLYAATSFNGQSKSERKDHILLRIWKDPVWSKLISAALLGLFALLALPFSDQEIKGPRFEFQGIEAKKSDGYYTTEIRVSNTSDIDSNAYVLTGMIFLSNSDIDSELAAYAKELKNNSRNYQLSHAETFRITRGLGLKLPLHDKFSEADILAVKKGTKQMYVMLLAIYLDTKMSDNKMWVTEACARIIVPFTDFQPCSKHNRYYLSDRSFNEIKSASMF